MISSITGDITKSLKFAKKEVKEHKLVYFLLFLMLTTAFIIRIYRVNDLLGFYFDQGRDALVIWDLWHKGKLFLIGPTTGLEGIFLGPLYYYLIAPFYLLGGGSPIWPSVFLALTSVIAIFVLYYLGWKIHGRVTGLIAATITSFSYYIFIASRWMSNPTPILLTSTLLLLSMWKIIEGKSEKWWAVLSIMLGVSLHFESASAIFYFPVVAAFIVWLFRYQKGAEFQMPSKRMFILSVSILLLTFLPQVVFNLRHDGILLNNFRNEFLTGGNSFSLLSGEFLSDRASFLWGVYSSKIYPGPGNYATVFTLLSFSALLFAKSENRKKTLTLLFIFIGVPLIGYMLFQGNYGNFYDYYLTGYYLPMVLFFSLGLGIIWQKPLGKLVVGAFFLTFLPLNLRIISNHLKSDISKPTHVSLGNQLEAVDWILADAEGRGEFNIDVYVPPVIPHAYDYLFLWKITEKCGVSQCGLVEERLPLLYTLYEADPPHPERLQAWLDRQKGIGEVKDSIKFGGITAERRIRF